MSKLTKKPTSPVLSRFTKTLVATTVLVSGCGDKVGVGAMDAGPADAMVQGDSGPDLDAPTVGVPPAEDAGPSSPDVGADAPGVDAPAPGLPPADAGPDGFVGI